MNGTRRITGWILVGATILGLGLSGLAQVDSDCWCAQYVDLREDVPTRNSSVFLRIAASAALTGLSFWGVDYLNPPNAQYYKISALVSGVSSTASALADLALPTVRSIGRDEDAIAKSTLSEGLCADTLMGYASRVRAHRYLSGAINLGSGAAQILLLSPIGQYATGDVWDYLFLVTGAIDIIGGLFDIIFSTSFERDVRDARRACGY